MTDDPRDPRDLRLTPQRQAVLNVLRTAGDHPSAGEVFNRVRRVRPGIGPATVYRSLARLVEGGYVRELSFGDGGARYDANTDRHDHLICDGCRRTVEVDLPVPDSLVGAASEHTGFVVRRYDLQFRGLCPGCQPPAPDRSTVLPPASPVLTPAQLKESPRMSTLVGTQTHENLKEAFAGESQANRRYLYFARQAKIENLPEIEELFQETAKGETGHAFGHLDFLVGAGDLLQALPEPPGVGLLRPGQGREPVRDLLKAFLSGGLGEARVHGGELIGLAGDRGAEVLRGVADRRTGGRVAGPHEEVEVAEGVAGLTLGRLLKELLDLGQVLDLGLAGEVQVATVGLALAGERLLEIFVGLRSNERGHARRLLQLSWCENGGSWRQDSGPVRGRGLAAGAETAKLQVVPVDHEAGVLGSGSDQRVRHRQIDLDSTAAAVANEVVVSVGVGVVAGATIAEREFANVAALDQPSQRAVDGGWTDARADSTHPVKHLAGAGVVTSGAQHV